MCCVGTDLTQEKNNEECEERWSLFLVNLAFSSIYGGGKKIPKSDLFKDLMMSLFYFLLRGPI